MGEKSIIAWYTTWQKWQTEWYDRTGNFSTGTHTQTHSNFFLRG